MLLFGTTKLFDKDLDLVEKRGKDIQKLEQIIQSLVWEDIFPVFSTVKETEIPFSSFVTETSLPVNVV